MVQFGPLSAMNSLLVTERAFTRGSAFAERRIWTWEVETRECGSECHNLLFGVTNFVVKTVKFGQKALKARIWLTFHGYLIRIPRGYPIREPGEPGRPLWEFHGVSATKPVGAHGRPGSPSQPYSEDDFLCFCGQKRCKFTIFSRSRLRRSRFLYPFWWGRGQKQQVLACVISRMYTHSISIWVNCNKSQVDDTDNKLFRPTSSFGFFGTKHVYISKKKSGKASVL